MTELWVKYGDVEDKVSIKDCKDISDVKKAIKTQLPLLFANFEAAQLKLYLNGTELKPRLTTEELFRKPEFQNGQSPTIDIITPPKSILY